jgi:hypothetical protein
MKKKINSETTTMFLLRSTYFNTRKGSKIPEEYFYISIPAHVIEKITQEQFEEFMMEVYEKNFDNPNSMEKLINDYYTYFHSLDKKTL